MSGTMLTSTCLVLILMSVLELSSATHGCPDGWLRSQGSCYALIIQGLTNAEAMIICNMLHAEIVEINSEEENAFILNTLELKKETHVWLGISDIFHEGKWVLGSTGAQVTYSKWLPNQPDDYREREDCAEFMAFEKGWNDLYCGARRMFICESAVRVR